MKTLEIKDIAAHLPYGVNVKHEDGICELHGFVGNNWLIDTQLRIHNIHTAKPILRPMSDLTEEITHRGEKFVPIVELAKIAYPSLLWRLGTRYEEGCPNGFAYCHTTRGYFSFEDNKFRYAEFSRGAFFTNVSYLLFDKLSELMFDYRGLIPAGLAIAVNTLEKNPYEV